MELQFHKSELECLLRPLRQVQEQEQTQELRLTEDMPDVGKVLGSWGQVLLRGKEWRGDSILLSGGVMVWVMYLPEGGGEPQHMEGWIPFQMKWDFPESQRDGIMRILPQLRSVDARSVSARKLMVRCGLSVCAEAYTQEKMGTYLPDTLPEDVQVLRREYPMVLPKEAGEKPFTLEETLELPASCPQLQKLVHYGISVEQIDKKVMADKAVFRGSAVVHLMYRTEDGSLHTWDFDVPYSQYTELEQIYDQDADIQLWMALTSMELEPGEDGKLLLKAGLTGQYIVYDKVIMSVVEDAYSTCRNVTLHKEELRLPAVLEAKTQTVSLRQPMGADAQRIVDVSVLIAQPRQMRLDGEVEAELNAGVQMLYYDREGMPQTAYKRWEETKAMPCGEDAAVDMQLLLTGKPQTVTAGDGAVVSADLLMDTRTVAQQGMQMVSGLTLGDEIASDPGRPSIILRRCDGGGLWEMAKKCGSTVDAIQKANSLEGDPEPGRLLLIPIA